MLITDKRLGEIKRIHGVNCAPYNQRGGDDQKKIFDLFSYIGAPHSRLHDCCGKWGGTHFVDIPNVFPNFDADENDPASYDFHYTDEYVNAILSCGTQIIYRLGVTIEWGSKQYVAHPPKDPLKWAKICEHVIMHYNEGWANGFHHGIEYWEIWNEPENPPMWTGTKDEFFNLYRVASKYLKFKFPSLKIGGYGSCGFYAVFKKDLSDFYKSFVPYFNDFLEMCREDNCPLDFFSWHIYTDKLDEIVKSSEYVGERLDKYGFIDTESHLNEWNYGAEGNQFEDKDTMVGASFVAAAFALMQKSDIHLAQYYVASQPSVYNGLLYMRSGGFTPVTHAFNAFNRIFEAKNNLLIESNGSEPYAIAAFDGEKTYVLISSYCKLSDSFKLEIPGYEMKISALSDAGFGVVREANDEISLPNSKYTVYFVEAVKKS